MGSPKDKVSKMVGISVASAAFTSRNKNRTRMSPTTELSRPRVVVAEAVEETGRGEMDVSILASFLSRLRVVDFQ